jgi:hypothetical protein
MTTSPKLLQSLIIYLICLPLALFLGYMLTDPLDLRTIGMLGIVILIITTPLILKFHHAVLVFLMNASMVAFFFPGRPRMWLVGVALSILVCWTHRALSQHYRFISVPELTRPLIVLLLVIFATAQARGGFGVRALGGSVYGGNKYFYLVGGILGYFALTGVKIPPRRAVLYVGLFFLSGVTNIVGDLFQLAPSWSHFFFLVFPPTKAGVVGGEFGETRWGGVPQAACAVFYFMLARYGLRGIFMPVKPARLACLGLVFILSLLGGFRSTLISLILVFSLQFYLEGLHRTRLLPAAILALALAAPICVAFAEKMPRTIQRSMAFLPINIDPAVKIDTERSSEWRLNMWRDVVPMIPQYLLLGKGFAMSPREFEEAQALQRMKALSGDQLGAAIAGDFHNGPLSVIIPFGIWGALAFIWLIAAGVRVLYRNCKNGDERLRTANTFILAWFLTRLVMFTFVVGAIQYDLVFFASLLGFSVSLNHGVQRPAVAPARAQPVNIPIRMPMKPSPGLVR